MIYIEGASFEAITAALAAAGVACTVYQRDESGTICEKVLKIDGLPAGVVCYVRRDGRAISMADVDAAFDRIIRGQS